jgi:hypothetical protein
MTVSIAPSRSAPRTSSSGRPFVSTALIASLALSALLTGAVTCQAVEDLPPIVYLPYDQTPTLTTKGQGVFLPYEKFIALWDAANPKVPEHKPAEPPIGAALAGFTISGQVTGDAAELAVDATVTALAKGWSQVELPAALALANFTPGDTRVVLERKASTDGKAGVLMIHLPEPGTYHCTATMAVPVLRDNAGKRSVDLVLPAASAGRLDVVISSSDADITLVPQVAATIHKEPGGTHLLAVLGGAPSLAIAWQPPTKEATGDVLLLSDNDCRLTVGERSIRYDLTAHLTILRRPLTEVTVALPPETQVLAVEAAGLRTWDKTTTAAGPPGSGAVVLHFHEGIEGEQDITLRLERLLPALTPGESRTVQVNWPEVVGQSRATGTITLTQGDGLSVAVDHADGLSQIDPKEIPAAQGAISAFRYLAAPPATTLTLTRLQSEVRVGVHELVHLGIEEDLIAILLDLEVRRAGIFSLTCVVPAAWDLVDSSGLALDDVRPLAQEGATRRYQFALRGRLLGPGQLGLRFKTPPSIARDGKAGDPATSIPIGVVSVLDARPLRGSLAIAAPRSWALSTAERSGVSSAEIEQLRHDGSSAVLMRELKEDEDLPLGFTFLGAGAQVHLLAAPRARELSLAVDELITAAEGHVRRIATLHGEVRYSAAAALRLQADSALDDKLVFKGANLAEHAAVAHDKGLTTWELRFQSPLLGAFTLTVEATVDAPPLTAGVAATMKIDPLRPLDTTHLHYLGAIAHEGTIEVTSVAIGLDAIAPADLPPALQGQGVVAGYQGATPCPIELTLVHHDLVTLADASVTGARYAAVIGDDGVVRVRGDLMLTTRGRPYLEVRLPAGASLLEVAISGRQGRPSRRTDGSVVVPLGDGGTLRTVPIALVYEQPLAGGKLGAMGGVDLALPLLGARTSVDGASEPPLPVEAVSVALFLPEGIAPFAWSGDFQRGAAARDLWSALLHTIAGDAVHPASHLAMNDDGLTVHLALVGTRHDLERLGDGGTLSFRFASTVIIYALSLIAAVLGVLSVWLLRQRSDALALLVASAVVLMLAVSIPWLTVVGGAVLGISLSLGALGARAVLRWARTSRTHTVNQPLASDPWQASLRRAPLRTAPTGATAQPPSAADPASATVTEPPAAPDPAAPAAGVPPPADESTPPPAPSSDAQDKQP